MINHSRNSLKTFFGNWKKWFEIRFINTTDKYQRQYPVFVRVKPEYQVEKPHIVCALSPKKRRATLSPSFERNTIAFKNSLRSIWDKLFSIFTEHFFWNGKRIVEIRFDNWNDKFWRKYPRSVRVESEIQVEKQHFECAFSPKKRRATRYPPFIRNIVTWKTLLYPAHHPYQPGLWCQRSRWCDMCCYIILFYESVLYQSYSFPR